MESCTRFFEKTKNPMPHKRIHWNDDEEKTLMNALDSTNHISNIVVTKTSEECQQFYQQYMNSDIPRSSYKNELIRLFPQNSKSKIKRVRMLKYLVDLMQERKVNKNAKHVRDKNYDQFDLSGTYHRDSDASEAEELHVVKSIVSHRVLPGRKFEFKVAWETYDVHDTVSWEHEDNFQSNEMIEAYFMKLRSSNLRFNSNQENHAITVNEWFQNVEQHNSSLRIPKAVRKHTKRAKRVKFEE